MAMKMQTVILIALLDCPEDIFADESQVEFWHLTEALFEQRNPVLSDTERESINALISAVQHSQGGKAKQRVIEGEQHPAGYAALVKWHAAYKFNLEIYRRVQKALEDEELSPHDLIWSRKNKLDDFPPRSDADGALDAIACAVFGENCLANARVVGEFKDAVSAMIHHEWERQRKKYLRAVKTLVNKKLIAQSAFAVDGDDKFPKEEEMDGGVQEMMSGLEDILQTAIKTSRKLPASKSVTSEEAVTDSSEHRPFTISPPQSHQYPERRGRRWVAHIKGITAAAVGNIEEIWATYVQLFELKPACSQQLQRLCAWDGDNSKQFFSDNPDMKPLRLLWHQLVGVASIIDKIFVTKPVQIGPPGILVADAVGVGKTALTMGTLAFIIDAFYVQEAIAGRRVGGKLLHTSDTDISRAEIFIERVPCFVGRTTIDDLPDVVVVRNSLIRQWTTELRHGDIREGLRLVIDEAHEFRNASANWYVVLELTRAARLPLLLTATPLFTSPQDLCKLGRLLCVPQFCGKDGDKRENAFMKKLRCARRGITRVDKAVSAEKALATMVGRDEMRTQISIRGGYGGRVIRRTVESTRYDGKMINDSLPPYKMVVVKLALTERELTIIRKVLDGFSSGSALETVEDGEALNSKFYLEGRTKAAFPFHESPSYPVVATRVEYSILPCIVNADDNSNLNCPSVPLWTPLEADESIRMPLLEKGSRKILIYHEFAMMAPLILSILRIYGVDAVAINGTQTIEERDRSVVAFQNDEKCRVLLLSNVGAVGLNLTAATVVILFDQCWSRMLVNQIIGRAWRLGQTERVIVYNLVCDQTVDCLMTDYAQGKGCMLEQFLSTAHGRDMKRLLGSGGPPIEEFPPEGAGADSNFDTESEQASGGTKKKRNLKSHKDLSQRNDATVGECRTFSVVTVIRRCNRQIQTAERKALNREKEFGTFNSTKSSAGAVHWSPRMVRAAKPLDRPRESAIQGSSGPTVGGNQATETAETTAVETSMPLNAQGELATPSHKSPKSTVGEYIKVIETTDAETARPPDGEDWPGSPSLKSPESVIGESHAHPVDKSLYEQRALTIGDLVIEHGNQKSMLNIRIIATVGSRHYG
ncbi:hypothetical protein L210DRAFT_934667 [Boletus edulis BED1]|uniref:Uncharacterized protein n=1 Tax=Boletus edulis BED1 TaxID=1328754 RepID=A0AAD4BI71_BOLED|nr:hypothetical protein L210DRAFT_934667 [Boletus edulis BED1]